MTDVTSALEAVGALIGERSKYEGWISALASKSDVPAHVLEKVRADYTGRLRTVLQAFTAHTPALESALAEHQSRDASLAAQEKACRDEHAEGELRHMVGEYDSEQWDKVRIGHEALLSRLSSDRQGIATELAAVQKMLAAAGEAAQRARALGGDVAPVSAPARDESPTPAILAAMTEPSAPVAAAAEAPAPLSPNTFRPTPQAPPPELMDRRTQIDDLGFLRTSPRPPRENGIETLSSPTATVARPVEQPVLRIVQDTPAGGVTVPTPSAPVAATDSAKTLRCAECGTMNYATEWYCERCGGELAVL